MLANLCAMRRLAALGIVMAMLGSGPIRATSSRCDVRRAKDVVRSFIRAYNKGDLGTLNRLFAPTEVFQEYRVHPIERMAPFSEDRATLMDYFAERHDLGDHVSLTKLRVGEDPAGGFYAQATVTRRSDEGFPWSQGTFVPGKSGLGTDCKVRLWRWTWDGP